MLQKLIETEHTYNSLLPLKRLEQSPPQELLAIAKTWSDMVWDEAEKLGPMPLSVEVLKNGRELADNPVFICGVHRSGTTLVRNILDGHPELVVLPSEGTFYTNLEFQLQALPENARMGFLGKEWLRRLVNPINQPPYWLLGHSEGSTSLYINFARYFMAWWAVLAQNKRTQWPHMAVVLAYAASTGNIKAKLWVDKTPANERFIKRIWQEMPNAKIVHVIRDPFATLASRKKMEPAISLRHALRDLKVSFDVAIEYANDPRFMLLRYEELCEAPEKVTGQMAAFLNIEELPALNIATVAGIPAQANSSFSNAAKSGEILSAGQHLQPEVLTTAEQQLVAACMGILAGKLGYAVTKPGVLRNYYLRLKHGIL